MPSSIVKRVGPWFLVVLLCCWLQPAWSGKLPEYQLKAAFLYNFASFTEWPVETGEVLNLCVYGEDPFGDYLDALRGKKVGDRIIETHRISSPDRLLECQLVFIARSVGDGLPQLLEKLNGNPILLVADVAGAARQGVALNMDTSNNRITFEANLAAVRDNGLRLSSRLLRLATEVTQ